MNTHLHSSLLGELLLEAGLISKTQLDEAIHEQQQLSQDVRLGEILARRGYINQETADFFAEHFELVAAQESKLPLGEYLSRAALLDQKQISLVLQDQEINHMRFGITAMLKGFISHKTLNFFLSNLSTHKGCINEYWRVNQSKVKQNNDADAPQKNLIDFQVQALALEWMRQQGWAS